MNIIKQKNIYYLISAMVIIPGLISLLLFGLNPSIEFTGGSRLDLAIKNVKVHPTRDDIKSVIEKEKVKVLTVVSPSKQTYVVRTSPISEEKNKEIVSALSKKYPGITKTSFQTVGATIGRETETNALKAVVIASVAILGYIAFVFRKVSKPVSSWKYGVCAIIALLHDVLLVAGIFSLLGHFFHIEVDSLFITALLTVMGFSVHDTIVVFDRIRENLSKHSGLPYEKIVNNSILETLNRSLNTSVTVTLVLFMLFLFGGENTRWFVVALLIGIISGTYSSIFNASPLLVSWYEFDKRSFSSDKKISKHK